MQRRVAQNLLFSALITVLGALASSFSTIVDRIAVDFGQPPTRAGLYIAFYAMGSLTSVLLSSALADVVGKRRVIVAALLLLLCGLALLSIPAGPTTYIGLFLMGVGFGPSEAMSSALLTDENPREAARWMNISQIGFCLGAIGAPIAAVAWLETGRSFRGVFLICGILILLAFVLILRSSGPLASWPQERFVFPKNLFTVLKNRTFALYALMVFLYLGFESVAPPYIKQFFLSTQATETLSSAMISLFWAAMIIGRLAGAFLGGRELLSIRVFTAMVIAGVALLLGAQTNMLRVLGVFLYGLGCGPVWPMLFVLAAEVFPERTGAAYGVMMLSSMAGNFLFPLLIGSFVGSLPLTFILCAFLASLVLASTFPAVRMRRSAP